MRALITGITGFVGGHLAEHLLAAGDQVAGCSRRGAWPVELAHLADRARLLTCDLGEPRAVPPLFDRDEYDVVFHLAGLANPRACRDDPALARRQNVAGTKNLYEAIRASGQRPRVLFVSTAYVYGQPSAEHLPVRSDCPIETDHPYAATKWEAEQCSMRYVADHGLDIVRVRPFNHTGPRQPAGYVVPDWAAQVVAIERGQAPPLLEVGNLDTRRDYTDVRDVVRAYRLLVTTARAGEVYNLGSSVATSGRDILDVLARLSSASWRVEPDAARQRTGEAAVIVADAAPLRQLTGWRPQVNLETTVRDTLDHWRARPSRSIDKEAQ